MKLLLVILIFSVQITFGQSNFEKIDDILSMLHNQEQFNGSVLIAEKGKITFKKNYGLANEETKKTLDENSVFELASVSKQFTAMGIVILKERGKLAYDDKITKFLPELEEYKDVSIRNLLNHTSGLPDYIHPKYLSLFDRSKINTNKDLIDLLVKNKVKLSFEPNTKFEYSNTGYVLLASIIEKVSGQSFASFLDKSIFKPLKMDRTFVYSRRLMPRKIDDYAFGYIYSNELKKRILPDASEYKKYVIYLDGMVGDGNVSSTVNDLLKWDRALSGGKLFSQIIVKEIYTTAVLQDNKPTTYGFGWFIENDKDYGEIAKHGGSFPGYKTYIERHLTNDKTIIILQNYEDVVNPVKNIREILYNKPLTKFFRTQIAVSSDVIAKCVGEYKDKSDEKSIISISKGDNSIIYNSTENPWNLKFYPETNTMFFSKVGPPNLQIEFVSGENGVSTIKLYQNGEVIAEGVKVK
jgi:CubicO group peptidase (beta-lactamase class C family)